VSLLTSIAAGTEYTACVTMISLKLESWKRRYGESVSNRPTM